MSQKLLLQKGYFITALTRNIARFISGFRIYDEISKCFCIIKHIFYLKMRRRNTFCSVLMNQFSVLSGMSFGTRL